jgi:hypothetical protein
MTKNIVWILNNYPPVVLAGAEFAAHRLNRWLLAQGHRVKVYIQSRESYPSEFEGVQIVPFQLMDCYTMTLEPDTILLSQLWATRSAHPVFDRNPYIKYIEFVHYVDHTVISPYPWTNKEFHMVYNSNDTKTRALAIGPWLQTKPSHIIPPYFEPPVSAKPRTDPKAYSWITLVNFSKDKGADLFNQLAQHDPNPDRKYVGMKGSHGTQETPCERVELRDPTLDMESVWEKTRVLVVLSTYETWSLVATEAMARGIPVLCANHIPALKENCGDAAQYVDRTQRDDCLAALEYIDLHYNEISIKSIEQVKKHVADLDMYKPLFM